MIKKILISIYIGFLVYCSFTLFSGAVGFSNMTALNYFKINMEEHVGVLEIKGQKLEDEISRLSNDADRLEIAARPMGYVESGQKMIKILNNKVKKTLYDLDRQYEIPAFERNSNRIILVSSLFTVILFVLSLFVGVILDTFKRK